jgi:hypothetical protein
MGDLLKDGLAWLTTQLKASASQPVTYVRGGDMIAVYATLGQTMGSGASAWSGPTWIS